MLSVFRRSRGRCIRSCRAFCSESNTNANDILSRVGKTDGGSTNLATAEKNEVVTEPHRDPTTIPIPSNPKLMEEAVAIAILERRRHQYLQEYPGGPIDRYLPPSDPYAFLIEDSKLTESERVWQKVFTVLPFVVFVAMVASPFILLKAFLPGTQAHKASIDLEKRKQEEYKRHIPSFRTIPFHAVVDVIERPLVSVILLYSGTFESKVLYPTMAEIDKLFRKHSCPVGVCAIDLTKDDVAEEFAQMYPKESGPYIQLVVPSKNDEEGNMVVDYKGKMKADWILREVARHTLLNDELQAEAQQIDEDVAKLYDELFSLMFVDDRDPHPSVFHRLFARNNDKYEKYDFKTEIFDNVFKQVSLNHGVKTAITSVRQARQTLADLVSTPAGN